MTTPSVARTTTRSPRRRPQHRRGRHTSPHALQLRHVWPARGGVLADAAESYLLHVVLWAALLAVLGLCLALDAHAAAGATAAAGAGGTGFFRLRRAAAPAEDITEADWVPDLGEEITRAARPQLQRIARDTLDVPPPLQRVQPADRPAPPERTDLIPVVRRHPARPAQDVRRAYGRASSTIHVLRGANALLREETRRLSGIVERGTEQLRATSSRAAAAERRAAEAERGRDEAARDRDEADRAVKELRAALDDYRPAPDARQLAERLKDVWLLPTSTPGPDTDIRWRRVAQTAIDAVRGLWPIETWPLTPAEREQNHPADGAGWPHTSPGGRAEAKPPAQAAPPAPGDSTALAAAADEQLDALTLVIARRDLEITGGEWPRLTDLMRDHYRRVAADVVEAGWRPPLDDMLVPRGRRALLARVLTDHELLVDGRCRCTWAGPFDREMIAVEMWHAEHVAEQLLATGAAR